MADGKIVFDTGINTDGFKKSLKSLRKEAKNAGDQSGDSISQIGEAATKAEGKIGGLGTALAKLGVAISVAAVIKGLISLGKQAVELGSDIVEVQNVVDTAFGSMAYKIEEFSATSIQRFGMSKLSAKQTASTYMAMARSMGLTEDAASDMAIALTGLSGDVASFYNISQAEADTKLKSVFTGETETLKSLGVVMTQTNLDAFALANGFGKTTASMSQSELVALRYQYVMDKLGMAQGDFAKTSGSWANQTRILSENWKEFLSVIGQGLIQALTPAIQLLNKLMGYLISAANAFSAFMATVFGAPETTAKAQEAQAAAIGDAAEAESDLASNTKKATAELKRQTAGIDELNVLQGSPAETAGASAGAGTSAIVPITVSTGSAGTSQIEGSISKIRKLFEDLANDIKKKFAPSIDAWGKAFKGLDGPARQALGSIQESAANLMDGTIVPAKDYILGTWIPDIVNSFSQNFAPMFSDILGWAFQECAREFEHMCTQINKLTQDLFIPALELCRTVVTDMWDSIGSTWAEHGEDILAMMGTLHDGLREIWDKIYDGIIHPVLEHIQEALAWLWDNHLKPLWDELTQFFASLVECVLTLWNNAIQPFISFLVDTLAPIVTDVINTIVYVIGSIVATVADVIKAVVKALRGALDFVTGVFSGDWKKAWNGIRTAFSAVWDAIWSVFKGVINLIIDGLNALWRGLYSAIAGVVNGVGSIVEKIGDAIGKDWGFGIPTNPPVIPKLAQGAVIPPNRQFLAVLGDQKSGTNIEAPLDTIKQAVAEVLGWGSDRPITIVVQMDSKEVFRQVVRENNAQVRMNGKSPLLV